MADLKDQLPRGRRVDKRLRLGNRCRYRFFDQHVNPGLQATDRHLEMPSGRDDYRDQVDRVQESAEIRMTRDTEPGGNLPAAGVVSVDDGDQIDVAERKILLDVKIAEITDADNSRSKITHLDIVSSGFGAATGEKCEPRR
jgi:hypothetical protein